MQDEKPQTKDSSKIIHRIKPSGFKKNIPWRWVISMLCCSFIITVILTYLSSTALNNVGILPAFAMLFFFILVGILFDIVGIAVASANEKPFHSMCSRRINGSREAIFLIRNSEKVASFCNDVVGDISGIISGATGVIIVTHLVSNLRFNSIIISLLITGIIAAMMIGGKAIGKTIGFNHNNSIVFLTGRFISLFSREKARRD